MLLTRINADKEIKYEGKLKMKFYDIIKCSYDGINYSIKESDGVYIIDNTVNNVKGRRKTFTSVDQAIKYIKLEVTR